MVDCYILEFTAVLTGTTTTSFINNLVQPNNMPAKQQIKTMQAHIYFMTWLFAFITRQLN